VRSADGGTKNIRFNLEGRTRELTEQQALFERLGFRPGPVVRATPSKVTEGSPAAAAGMEAGDRIVQVDSTPIESWLELVNYVRARPGEAANRTVERGGKELVLPITIGSVEDGGETIGRIGIEMPLQFAPEDV